MRQNFELRADARQQLKGNWGMPILACFLYGIIMGVCGSIPFGAIIIGGPMLLGLTRYFVMFKRGANPQIENLFDGFRLFGKSLLLQLVTGIFIFLWSLLLIVPGIIAALNYSQAFFIMNENPEIDFMDAIRQSKQMMFGYKGKLFLLYLSFIGWSILCIFTLGIGFLWLAPYVQLTLTNFYEDLRSNYQQPSVNI